MSARPKSSRRLRSRRLAVITTALAAAAIVLAGCWGKVEFRADGSKTITVTRSITDRVIWDCTVLVGAGRLRGICAIDSIGELCRNQQVQGVNRAVDCPLISDQRRALEMEAAIQRVVGPDHDCLSFVRHPNPGLDKWTAFRLGQARCVQS